MASRPLVLLTHPFIPSVAKTVLAPHVRVQIAGNRTELERLIARADGLVARLTDRIDSKLLDRAPRLRAIGCFAVGTDNVDLPACAARGIRVVNTPDVLTRATAELTLALLLAAARRIPEGLALCHKRRFKGWEPDMLLGLELQGRTAVLVGPGRIGRETARLFEGIGLRVEWLSRSSTATEIRQKLKRAQILSLHTPLTRETRHWLSAARLKLLPRDAIVLNTTRGPVVDEKALILALKSRRIFAVGLDVYENEPKIPATLLKLPNAVLLPHLGSATIQAREGMARLAMGGVLALLNGQNPPNEVKLR